MDGTLSMSEQWLDVCAVEDIPQRGARRFEFEHGVIGLFRTQSGEIYAIDNACPHTGGPLTEGIVHDCAVTCPLHSLIIDLKTGKARGNDEGQVSTYQVEVQNDRVLLNLVS